MLLLLLLSCKSSLHIPSTTFFFLAMLCIGLMWDPGGLSSAVKAPSPKVPRPPGYYALITN